MSPIVLRNFQPWPKCRNWAGECYTSLSSLWSGRLYFSWDFGIPPSSKTPFLGRQFRNFSSGIFTRDAHRQLAVTKLKSFVLDGLVNCALRCIGEPQCLSYNLAAHPDSDGLYRCDLLATDKYRATTKDFETSAAFHHYSLWVNIKTFLSFSFEGARNQEVVDSLGYLTMVLWIDELRINSLSHFSWKNVQHSQR